MGKKNSSLLSAALGAGLAAGAAFFYHKQKNKAEEQTKMKSIPAPQFNLEKELVKRMSDLLYYDRFQLVVQPVIDLQTGGIVGGEVLSRLNHPEQGVVIQYLSCNFSRVTLSEKSAATRLAKIADEYGVPHERMAVEITEREQETDTDQFCENLIEIKKAGFRIFVDDLGAGVTSIRDLWSYPVDVVKIDRSLLLATDTEQGRTAYRGLRNMAVDLGCTVLCEGVETEEQHRFVLDVGCHYSQGFLFYRPMDAEQFIYLMGGKG